LFRSVPTVEATGTARDDLVPLSVLALDLPQPPEGWPVFLGRRGVAFLPDDLGRDSVSRSDARRLLDEKREDELRRAHLCAEAEREAVEADQLRRALLYKGVPADLVPPGVHPATAMLQAAQDAGPRRVSPVEEALGGSGMTYHSMRSMPEAS
jgi:hypothetical protein